MPRSALLVLILALASPAIAYVPPSHALCQMALDTDSIMETYPPQQRAVYQVLVDAIYHRRQVHAMVGVSETVAASTLLFPVGITLDRARGEIFVQTNQRSPEGPAGKVLTVAVPLRRFAGPIEIVPVEQQLANLEAAFRYWDQSEHRSPIYSMVDLLKRLKTAMAQRTEVTVHPQGMASTGTIKGQVINVFGIGPTPHEIGFTLVPNGSDAYLELPFVDAMGLPLLQLATPSSDRRGGGGDPPVRIVH